MKKIIKILAIAFSLFVMTNVYADTSLEGADIEIWSNQSINLDKYDSISVTRTYADDYETDWNYLSSSVEFKYVISYQDIEGKTHTKELETSYSASNSSIAIDDVIDIIEENPLFSIKLVYNETGSDKVYESNTVDVLAVTGSNLDSDTESRLYATGEEDFYMYGIRPYGTTLDITNVTESESAEKILSTFPDATIYKITLTAGNRSINNYVDNIYLWDFVFQIVTPDDFDSENGTVRIVNSEDPTEYENLLDASSGDKEHYGVRLFSVYNDTKYLANLEKYYIVFSNVITDLNFGSGDLDDDEVEEETPVTTKSDDKAKDDTSSKKENPVTGVSICVGSISVLLIGAAIIIKVSKKKRLL